MLTKKRMFEIMKEAGMDVKKFDQLMQKETAQLSEEELSQIAGGFSDGTKDKYTVAEYAAAGVDFRYHRFACDAYVLRNHYIIQEGAEEAVRLYRANGNKPLTDAQFDAILKRYQDSIDFEGGED